MNILDKILGTFCNKVMDMVGARSLTFRELYACGVPKFFCKKDPIVSRQWLADIMNAF